jgi:nitroreductase
MWTDEEQKDLYREIFRRKSVRRYKDEPLQDGVLERILEMCTGKALPLNDEKAAFQILSGDQVEKIFNNAPHYLCLYARPEPAAAVNVSVIAEQVSLALSAQETGSCWLGMAKPKKAFMEYQGLPFYMMLAFGTPTEAPYRSDLKDFNRKPLKLITDISGIDDIMECARLAPSAMNRQSWYFSGISDALGVRGIRLYMTQAPLIGRFTVHLDYADAGIALAHLCIGTKDRFSGFIKEESVQSVRKNAVYYWTVNIK